MTTAETDHVAPVTRNCAAGNHVRCLGTVLDPAKGLTVCGCPEPDCGHGTETAKARRNRDH